MRHVSGWELRRFVASGLASATFEAHVDACAECAARLSGRARAAIAASERAPVAPIFRAELWLAFAAALAVLFILRAPQQPAPQSFGGPSMVASPSPSLSGGYVDGGVPDARYQQAPMALAALDGGGVIR